MSEKNWEEIGTVIGSTSTDSYGFLLTSLKGSLGDIVITETESQKFHPLKEEVRKFIFGEE